ncbi:hypothetical protein GCM10022297_13630 [Lactobacillus hamsteri]|uniref:SAM-dependent methyltransferase n=1 Tax=Lactobacillus hamsteri DSM 5661 = JCM 6256 TaxID=1423754 RepID=A0A0R1Y6J1_9LACO|nr:hypothetical protein [Lactobacillus hamsteri]KRM38056.1 hypothetical protein FC39_GL001449 [Lactobacillus hamsteri DSM 5661 = JCM 6256]
MTKFLQRLNQLDKELNNDRIHKQVSEINNIVAYVDKKVPIEEAPEHLGFYPDEVEELIYSIGVDKKAQINAMNHLLNSVRQFLSLKYGIWSLPNLKTAKLISETFNVKSVLEIMAGNAYWSKTFQEVGVEAIATDSLEWAKTSTTGRDYFTKVEDLDAVSAIKRYRDIDLIICSWSPNFGHSDLDVVNAWKDYSHHSKLLFIGEKEGATNSPEFWQQMNFVSSKEMKKINHSFESYDFIDEKVYEIEKI